jgi:hypothetical protein
VYALDRKGVTMCRLAEPKVPVARTLSLLRRDSSRRRADIDRSVDAARKSFPIAFRITIAMNAIHGAVGRTLPSARVPPDPLSEV